MAMGGHSDGGDGGRELDVATMRQKVGEVALELATTPEGRAAALSVEVWPHEGVWLRVRSGHELRLLVETRDATVWVRWKRIDPQQGSSRTSEGDLGPARLMSADDLRTFIVRWLSWRASQ